MNKILVVAKTKQNDKMMLPKRFGCPPLTVRAFIFVGKVPSSEDFLWGVIFMKTAILIDGAFFLYRARAIFGSLSPRDLAGRLHRYSCYHCGKKENLDDSLYRIFFYDCPPLTKKYQHPKTGKTIDFAKSEKSKWREAFHNELKRKPKLALRLGVIDGTNSAWKISSANITKLCRESIAFKDLTEDDISLDFKQKGVDMRIGLDIASITFKKQANRIVLVSGDSDFVPAAKLARREGLEFVLDPMWAPIKDDLHEHIDRLRSCFPRPNKIVNKNVE